MPDTLVLLPGLLNDAALWASQIEELSDLVDEIIVPDLTQFDDMQALATHVLEELPDRFALCGLSMGGYVAQEMLRQAPERVEFLALMDTSARKDSDDQRRRRKGLIELSERGRFKGVTPRLLPLLIAEDRLDDESVTAPIFEMAARVGRDGFIRQQRAILSRQDQRDLLPSVSVPSLVVCGREDQLTPPEIAEEMADLLPNSRLVIIEKCGHLPPLEQPEIASALLREWLED